MQFSLDVRQKLQISCYEIRTGSYTTAYIYRELYTGEIYISIDSFFGVKL